MTGGLLCCYRREVFPKRYRPTMLSSSRRSAIPLTPAVPAVGIQLLPNGLDLAEPATLTVALPEAVAGGLVAMHMSGDWVEFLDGDIEPEDKGLSFETSVGHFSVLWLYVGIPIFDTSVEIAPERVSVGQTQSADGTIAPITDPVTVMMWFHQDPPGTFRELTFSAPESVTLYRSSMWWDNPPGDWDPRLQEVNLLETAAGWETFAESKCLNPNETSVGFRTGTQVSLTLLDMGPPIEERSFAEFTRMLSAELTPLCHWGPGTCSDCRRATPSRRR